MPLSSERVEEAYRLMHVIRKFEETIRQLYTEGRIRGSFHPCVGQEATAVGACLALQREDTISCTYRGHGHAIAKGLSVRAAMAEMLGKRTGCSKGKGGSMHFTDPAVGLLGANAIVAAGIPHAAGAALAAQMQKSGRVALAFFGDGAVNQGVFHETMNLIAVWKLPIILVCENNLYAEMTPAHETTSDVETWRRAASYGITAHRANGNDVETMYAAVEEAVARARDGQGATYLEAMTYRLWGHMMGDPEVYRSKDEVSLAWQNEPIAQLGRRMLQCGYSSADLARSESEAEGIVGDALRFGEESPDPMPDEALTDIFA